MHKPTPAISPEIVIARIRPEPAGGPVDAVDVDLFLPGFDATWGRLLCWSWVGEHGEASLDYYRETKAPRGLLEMRAVAEAVRHWQRCTGRVALLRSRLRWRWLEEGAWSWRTRLPAVTTIAASAA